MSVSGFACLLYRVLIGKEAITDTLNISLLSLLYRVLIGKEAITGTIDIKPST